MKLIHLVTASYAALAGMIAQQFYKFTENRVEGVIDNICFVHMEMNRPECVTSSSKETPVIQTLNPQPEMISMAVNFTQQLAMMQQSLNRANTPIIHVKAQLEAVPQPIRGF